MQEFFDTYNKTKSLHHAYFFVGDRSLIETELLNFFENELKIKTKGNPDFKNLKFENLSIDDARGISRASERKSFDKGKMIFLLSFESISHEAQNSLLKTFEEPTGDTHFFLISEYDSLLPTLKSRLQTIKCDLPAQAERVKVWGEEVSRGTLDMSLRERLVRVKEIVDSISDEEGTKQDAFDFLNEIEAEIYQKGLQKFSKEFEICRKTRESLLDRGAPVKMILENLVLSI
ncbi:MAG: hypothetical protein WAX44_03845 [Minisyncoccia bacterium]